jgi:hypothetical protein
LLIQHQFGHQELEPLDLDLEFAVAAVRVDPGRIVALTPAMIGRLGDADLSADIPDGQPLGQVAIGFSEQSGHFVGLPSLPHESLLNSVYRGTPISGGPVFGGQATGSPLIEGKLYLQLYHGRTDPDQQMEDWGFVGPTFGPLSYVVQTYCTTLRLHGDPHHELWLAHHDDMVVWGGAYYGDMSIFVATGAEHG